MLLSSINFRDFEFTCTDELSRINIGSASESSTELNLWMRSLIKLIKALIVIDFVHASIPSTLFQDTPTIKFMAQESGFAI